MTPFTVWLVDGAYVRSHLNEEFTNFGQHYRFPCIPNNEFWIDHFEHPHEAHFFVDHLLREYQLMKKGLSYPKALTLADKYEQRERDRLKRVQELKHLERSHPEEVIKKIHMRKLYAYSSPVLAVWIVHSELVRDLFYIDFTEGGHDYVYDFVPKGEIWLDHDLTPRERRFVLLHELHERRLMATKKWEYHKAHHAASCIEHYCRVHPRALSKHLEEETKKNQKLSSVKTK